MAIFDVESGKYAKLPKAFVVENGKYVALKNAFVVEGGKYVKVWSDSLNLFVVAGGVVDGSKRIAHSTDGITWVEHEITLDGAPCSDYIYSIAYSNGIFVADMGLNHVLTYSTDGINFFTNETGTSYSGGFRIGGGGGKFVAMGASLNGTNPMYYSVDGKTWTQCDKTFNFTTAVWRFARPIYANGIWYIGGSQCFWWSKDCVTWTLVWGSSDVFCRSFVYAFGKWWRIGRTTGGAGEIAYSTNGTSFTVLNSSVDFKCVPMTCAYGNDVVAIMGFSYYDVEASYMTSDGTVNATNLEIASYDDSDATVKQVVFHEKFVAVGSDGYIMYSLDGINWTKTQPFGSTTYMNSICYTAED